jgi:ribosomal protein L11 methyltransferase
MKYPALDVTSDEPEFVLATADEFSPAAAVEQDGMLTLFFTDSSRRDLAREAIAQAHPRATVSVRDVDDEDWARRSQRNLQAVTVGRVTVAPPWGVSPESQSARGSAVTIVVQPSTGFGTGHHPTTRLCLRALQSIDLAGKSVLDVGTGSGVLALAARALGAARACGIDHDADALQAANENLPLNPSIARVTFLADDLTSAHLPTADVVVANLTGALLCRTNARLASAVSQGGTLVVSGLQTDERDDVLAAFSRYRITWEAEEEGWTALALRALDPLEGEANPKPEACA